MFKESITDIFFDLDHTLWDFEKNSRLTFLKIFEKKDVDASLEDFLFHYVPLNLEYWKLYREERVTKEDLRYQRLRRTFDALGYPIEDELIDILSDQYIENLSSFNHLVPETIDILEYLSPKYRLHIITNGFKEIQEKKLRQSNISKYFDQVVNSEMAGVKKPNPGIFQLALQMANVDARKSLMIGDNIEADILGAKAVGFHAIHFNAHNDPSHEHCQMIQRLGEIKSYL